jgi:hypothetical protein
MHKLYLLEKMQKNFALPKGCVIGGGAIKMGPLRSFLKLRAQSLPSRFAKASNTYLRVR